MAHRRRLRVRRRALRDPRRAAARRGLPLRPLPADARRRRGLHVLRGVRARAARGRRRCAGTRPTSAAAASARAAAGACSGRPTARTRSRHRRARSTSRPASRPSRTSTSTRPGTTRCCPRASAATRRRCRDRDRHTARPGARGAPRGRRRRAARSCSATAPAAGSARRTWSPRATRRWRSTSRSRWSSSPTAWRAASRPRRPRSSTSRGSRCSRRSRAGRRRCSWAAARRARGWRAGRRRPRAPRACSASRSRVHPPGRPEKTRLAELDAVARARCSSSRASATRSGCRRTAPGREVVVVPGHALAALDGPDRRGGRGLAGSRGVAALATLSRHRCTTSA